MNGERLGPQVLTAVKFRQQIYHDLDVLVRHTDKVFDENGWKPTDKTNVFARVGNRLNPKAWLLTQLCRFYVPKSASDSVDRVIAIMPVLDPPEGYDEPICTACILKLSRSVKPKAFTKKRKPFRALPARLGGRVGVFELPRPVMVSLFPQASDASVVVVLLCGLTGECDLVEQLVKPALAAQPPAP